MPARSGIDLHGVPELLIQVAPQQPSRHDTSDNRSPAHSMQCSWMHDRATWQREFSQLAVSESIARTHGPRGSQGHSEDPWPTRLCMHPHVPICNPQQPCPKLHSHPRVRHSFICRHLPPSYHAIYSPRPFPTSPLLPSRHRVPVTAGLSLQYNDGIRVRVRVRVRVSSRAELII